MARPSRDDELESDDEGLLDSLSDCLATDRERGLIEELRRELATDLADTPGFPDVVGNIRLLRTLRAFDHAVPDAAEAFRGHLAIRRAHGLDRVRGRVLDLAGDSLWELRTDMMPHGEVIGRFMPEVFMFARTLSGDPVGLGLWGRGRPSAFVQEVQDWQDKFLEYYLFMNEARMMLIDQASRDQNRLVHYVHIFDLEDWSIVGNSDRAWTAFATERTRPVGETYHDCNAAFVAVRTTAWARMAYNVIKPILPKKVTDKIHLLNDDFSNSRYAQALLDAGTLEKLRGRAFASAKRRRQEGKAAIKPRQAFELPIEVPSGATVRWRFGIEAADLLRQGCWLGPLPGISNDLVFSVSSGDGQEFEGVAAPSWAPQRVASDAVATGRCEGSFGKGQGPGVVVMRWDNTHAWLTSKTLSYRVEVELPQEEAASSSAAARVGAAARRAGERTSQALRLLHWSLASTAVAGAAVVWRWYGLGV